MADDIATADKPLTAEEVRKAMLHMATALHNLQVSVEETIRRIGINAPGIDKPGERALRLSQLELADTLKILVRDPGDG
jgi:hypothetical protein